MFLSAHEEKISADTQKLDCLVTFVRVSRTNAAHHTDVSQSVCLSDMLWDTCHSHRSMGSDELWKPALRNTTMILQAQGKRS